jgi:hypothetical protein
MDNVKNINIHTPKQTGFMWGQMSYAVYHSIKFHLSGYYNSSLTIKHKIDHHNTISQSIKISINNRHIVLKDAYYQTERHFTECGTTVLPLWQYFTQPPSSLTLVVMLF